MTKITIFHNPRCSKSRQTLQLLQDHIAENNATIEIVEYLKQPPSAQQLGQILTLLNMTARQLMRIKEIEYKEQDLANTKLSEDALIAAMIATPKLIERPIVLANGKAAIGRPPEQVLEIL
jgi:arsenate reductase